MDKDGQNSQSFQYKIASINHNINLTPNTVLENENLLILIEQENGQNSQSVNHFSETLEEFDYNKQMKSYYCECCNYSTVNKSDYKKHILTNKHKTNSNKTTTNKVVINAIEIENKGSKHGQTAASISYTCSNCEKEFIIYNSYWKHTHRPCKKRVLKQSTKIKPIDNDTALEILKQNTELATKNSELCELVLTMCKENKDLHKILLEQNANNSVGNITNNTTINNMNHFNLNVFLNEHCKDAINLNTFINDLVITVEDYEQTGKLGYVENLSRILINGLKQLDVYKRPIHCTDIKRETIYIKENDKWDKDNEKNEKIIGVVETIAERNLKTFPKWAALHPNHRELDSIDNKKCLELYKAALGSESPEDLGKEHNKIVKNVLKTVTIDNVKNKLME
jgi:hypothetical protein